MIRGPSSRPGNPFDSAQISPTNALQLLVGFRRLPSSWAWLVVGRCRPHVAGIRPQLKAAGMVWKGGWDAGLLNAGPLRMTVIGQPVTFRAQRVLLS